MTVDEDTAWDARQEALSRMEGFFEKYNDEYCHFERIEGKLSERPDLHAFLMLDRLVPGSKDIVSGASHEEIFFGVDAEDLAMVVTEEQVRDLRRCGVRCSDGHLCMFA